MQTVNFEKGEILSFTKPYGWTSFQVVSRARGVLKRILKTRKIKVGHAGTLDPLATGVLIVCTGKATKKIEELQSHTKEYIATLKLGATTPSYDRETEEDCSYPTAHITEELLRSTLKQFVGSIQQVPPVFSAVKIDGKRAYSFARKGEEVQLGAKTIVIDEIELLDCNIPESVRIRVVCSKGTYIRALARDIGESLQSGAYLTDLCRTRIGDFRIDSCLNIEEFGPWVESCNIEREETKSGNQ